MTQYIIYDLDGCIADDRARLPLIDPEQVKSFLAGQTLKDPWAKYHTWCFRDPLINEHWVAVGRHLAIPVIFTSRPEAVRAKTQEWLREVAGLHTELLFMRPDDDHTPSAQLKEHFLRKLEQAFSPAPLDIALALDDQRDILDMYEGYGIETAQTFYPEEVVL